MDTYSTTDCMRRDWIAQCGQRYAIALVETRKRQADVPTLADHHNARLFTELVVSCADALMRVPS